MGRASKELRGLSWAVAVCLSLCSPKVAGAQGQNQGPPPAAMGSTAASSLPDVLNLHQGAALRISVLNDAEKRLDRQALAKLHCDNPDNTVYQTTKSDSETIFFGLHYCKYDLEISAVGYLSVHKSVEVTGYVDTLNLDIILQRDPMAVDFDAAGTADALMSPRASKETRRAVKALQEGHFKEASKHLESAYKQAPSSARVNFLLGYESFQERNLKQAEAYLTRSTTLDPNNAQALSLLGRVQNMLGNSDQARTVLERAVVANPNDVLAHELLGDAYLKEKQYEKAREQARAVLARKRNEASAELLLGQAEGNLGNTREAIEALTAYIQAMPTSPLSPQVHSIISQLEQQPVENRGAAAPGIVVSPVDAESTLNTSDEGLSTKWQPPGVDDVQVIVASGVPCPANQVLERVGKRMQELVDNVRQFSAIEDLLHERLDKSGSPSSRELRKFEYAANVAETPPGFLMVDEYRTERYTAAELPDKISTSGFPALAFVFHPTLQPNYEMTCEGLGEWRGQATWLVHFRQREDRPSRIQSFKDGYSVYAVNLKGRAWITADTFQVVRIEAELVSPMRQIRYLTQHSVTEYAPVYFKKKNIDVWLPKSAEVYLDFRGHRYYRRHSFDHYMLFSVDSQQTVREAKHGPRGPGSTTPRKHKYWPA
ncbi:MAG: tetratricopeptide repeat protein [Acidobacteriaceae bacterium]|nr:tetratricopeptide repeat protein [Acidobacteriaceae bacterium]